MMGESVARAACICEDVKSGHAGALHGLGRGGGRRPPGSCSPERKPERRQEPRSRGHRIDGQGNGMVLRQLEVRSTRDVEKPFLNLAQGSSHNWLWGWSPEQTTPPGSQKCQSEELRGQVHCRRSGCPSSSGAWSSRRRHANSCMSGSVVPGIGFCARLSRRQILLSYPAVPLAGECAGSRRSFAVPPVVGFFPVRYVFPLANCRP